ncbi:MAG: radical SAM protein [Candidatus Omnitrophota bacterium]
MLKKILNRIYYRFPAFFSGTGLALPCRNVVFELVYSCNLNCEMCPYKAETTQTEPSGSDFKPLEKEEIIRLLHEFPKGSNITFTGGEPFLKEGILEILEEAARLHNVTLATNGTLITDEIAEKVVNWALRLLGFSLDGPRDIHNDIRRDPGAFDKLANGVKRINDQKKKQGTRFPKLNFNGVILKKNFAFLEENIELAKELGVSFHTFQICDPSWDRSGWRLSDKIKANEKIIEQVEKIDRKELKGALDKLIAAGKRLDVGVNFMPPLTPEEIVDYYDHKFDLSKWHCLSPWSTMRISPYGDVFPCLNFKVGNIRRQKPGVLWNSPNYRKFRRELGKVSLFESCTGCCKMKRRLGG